MKRGGKDVKDVLLTARVPGDLVERLERHVERMRRETPYLGVSRSDAVRVLLGRALDIEEAKVGAAPPTSAPALPGPERPARGRSRGKP